MKGDSSKNNKILWINDNNYDLLSNQIEQISAQSKLTLHSHKKNMKLLDELEEQLTTINSMSVRIRGVKYAMEKISNKLGIERVSIEEEVKVKQEEIQADEKAIDEIIKRQQNNRAHLAEDISKTKSEIEALNNQYRDLKEEVHQIGVQIKEKDRMYQMIQQDRMDDMNTIKKDNKLSNDKISERITGIQCEIIELENKIASNNGIKETSINKHNSLVDDNAKLRQTIELLNNDIKHMKHVSLQSRVDKSSKLKEMEEKIFTLGSDIERVKGENKSLKQSINAMKSLSAH